MMTADAAMVDIHQEKCSIETTAPASSTHAANDSKNHSSETRNTPDRSAGK